MSENTYTLTAADFADILATTLAMADEAGLSVAVQNRPTTGDRPAGLLLFVSGLRVDERGQIVAAPVATPAAPVATPAAPEEQQP